MAYGNLLNAFSSGLVDGVRAGVLMDATFAEQDQRELQESARDVQGFVEYLAASDNDFNKALSTPDGQQMAFRAIASNPVVRESFAANPGFEPVGMVRTPDGRFAFVGRHEDGSIKPLSAGGKAVTYDGQQMMAMTAASAGRLGVQNTAQGQADLETVAGAGDVFDALEKQGLGPANELRALSQQGNDFIRQGGIPRQKPGIPAIRAAVQPAKAAQKEAVLPDSKAPAEKARISVEVPALLRAAPVREEVPSSDPMQLEGKSFDDLRKAALPTLSEQKARYKEARAARKEAQEKAYQAAVANASIPRDLGEGAREAVEFVGRGFEGFRNYVTKPAARAVEKVGQALGEGVSQFSEGFSGNKKAPPAVTTKAAPPAATTKAASAGPSAPASVAQKAVQKERVSRKVMDSPEKLDQLDAAFVQQISSEAPKQRVENDSRALDRLSKLASGKRPNSAQLHAAYRLAKSGLIPAQALAEFTQTGRLSNVAFDNAYKEHSIRQGYAQLAQGDRRLNFDMFKEQREEARSLRGQQVSVMKEVLRQQGLADKEAQKAAEKLDKEGRGMLTQTVASQFRQMPRYKDASDSVIKDEAETAVAYMLANPQYVGTMLGGRTAPMSMPDFVVLSEGIPDMVNQTVGSDGFWSSKTVLGHAFERFKNAQKSLTGGQ